MVPERLTAVRHRIAEALRRSGRPAGSVTLVAVSKGQPVEAIAAAHAAGHRDFGENRAGELIAKVGRLPADIRWHFVGTVQRRKVRRIRPLVALLHSLDRGSLAEAWARRGEGETAVPPPVLIQVDVAGEPQKHGVSPEALPELLERAVAAGIECRGLMVIPPLPETPQDSRRWFERLAALEERLAPEHPGLTELSMGMSDDLEVAVETGATLVRVGRAIFGPRDRVDHTKPPTGERGA